LALQRLKQNFISFIFVSGRLIKGRRLAERSGLRIVVISIHGIPHAVNTIIGWYGDMRVALTRFLALESFAGLRTVSTNV